MKKSILLFCLWCLAVAGQPAFGQKIPKISSKALTSVRIPATKLTAASLKNLTDQELEALLAQLSQESAALERQIAAQKAQQEKIYNLTRKAVFRSLSSSQSVSSFSGTLFKINYKGQDEIFGVVPMHILRDKEHFSNMLSYKFTVAVFVNKGIKYIPAYVVKISSSKTGDLALVKFRKKDEALLFPLALSTQAPQFPKQVYSQGFARNLLSQSAFQLTNATSTGTLLAQIPAAYYGDRAGFCGSPVVDNKAQLCGVHIGSAYIAKSPMKEAELALFHSLHPSLPFPSADVGYVAPVSFLEKLVAAYHNPQLQPLSVTLAGHEVAHLAINEYVSQITLLDEHGHSLWFKEMNMKVSLSSAEKELQLRKDSVAAIRLEIGRTHWAKDEKGFYITNTPAVRNVVYTLDK